MRTHRKNNKNQRVAINGSLALPWAYSSYFSNHPDVQVLSVNDVFASSKTKQKVSPYSVIRFNDRISCTQYEDVTVRYLKNNQARRLYLKDWKHTYVPGAVLFLKGPKKRWVAYLHRGYQDYLEQVVLLPNDPQKKKLLACLNGILTEHAKNFDKMPLIKVLLELQKDSESRLFEGVTCIDTFLGAGAQGVVAQVVASYKFDFDENKIHKICAPRVVKVQHEYDSGNFDSIKFRSELEKSMIQTAYGPEASVGMSYYDHTTYSIYLKSSLVQRTTFIEMKDYTEGQQKTGVPLHKVKIKNFADALQINLWILEALAQLHEKGIIHGDLKQEQIILDRKNKCVYIVDFGLSKYANNPKSFNVVSGTPCYLPPEILHYDYSVAIDSFAYTALLAELFIQAGGGNRTDVTKTREDQANGNSMVCMMLPLDLDLTFRQHQLSCELKEGMASFLKNMGNLDKSKRHSAKEALDFLKMKKIHYYVEQLNHLIMDAFLRGFVRNKQTVFNALDDLKQTLFLDTGDIKAIVNKILELNQKELSGYTEEIRELIKNFLNNTLQAGLQENNFIESHQELEKAIEPIREMQEAFDEFYTTATQGRLSLVAEKHKAFLEAYSKIDLKNIDKYLIAYCQGSQQKLSFLSTCFDQEKVLSEEVFWDNFFRNGDCEVQLSFLVGFFIGLNRVEEEDMASHLLKCRIVAQSLFKKNSNAAINLKAAILKYINHVPLSEQFSRFFYSLSLSSDSLDDLENAFARLMVRRNEIKTELSRGEKEDYSVKQVPPEAYLHYFKENPFAQVLPLGVKFKANNQDYHSLYSVIQLGDCVSCIQDEDVTVHFLDQQQQCQEFLESWKQKHIAGAVLFLRVSETSWVAYLHRGNQYELESVELTRNVSGHQPFMDYFEIPFDLKSDLDKSDLVELLYQNKKNLNSRLFTGKTFVDAFLGQGAFGAVVPVIASYKCDFKQSFISKNDTSTPRVIKVQHDYSQDDKYNPLEDPMREMNMLKIAYGDNASHGTVGITRDLLSPWSQNCIPCYSAFTDMEDYTGEQNNKTGVPLRNLPIKNFADALQINLWILKALIDHVHGKSIIHGDLKPDQIIIDRKKKRAFVVDFGCAIKGDMKKPTSLKGTVYFLPPEVLKNDYSFHMDYFAYAALAAGLFLQSSGSDQNKILMSRLRCPSKKEAKVIKTPFDLDNLFICDDAFDQGIKSDISEFLKLMGSLHKSKRKTTAEALVFFQKQKIRYYACQLNQLLMSALWCDSLQINKDIFNTIADLKQTLFLEDDDITAIVNEIKALNNNVLEHLKEDVWLPISDFLRVSLESDLEYKKFEESYIDLKSKIKPISELQGAFKHVCEKNPSESIYGSVEKLLETTGPKEGAAIKNAFGFLSACWCKDSKKLSLLEGLGDSNISTKKKVLINVFVYYLFEKDISFFESNLSDLKDLASIISSKDRNETIEIIKKEILKSVEDVNLAAKFFNLIENLCIYTKKDYELKYEFQLLKEDCQKCIIEIAARKALVNSLDKILDSKLKGMSQNELKTCIGNKTDSHDKPTLYGFLGKLRYGEIPLHQAHQKYQEFLEKKLEPVINQKNSRIIRFFESIGDIINAYCTKWFGKSPFNTTHQRALTKFNPDLSIWKKPPASQDKKQTKLVHLHLCQ